MIHIRVEDRIKEACPDLRIAVLACSIRNSSHSPELWQEIAELEDELRHFYPMEEIKYRPAIEATREAYKTLGKDPNRYRPSAEALCRRTIRNLPLYQINTAVDAINLLSLRSGYSIGGFDADRIEGDLRLGVGRSGESFNAIGRGMLNIEGLPIYRDNSGGIGTPTSDEERTKISLDTSHLLLIINAYSGEEGLAGTVDFARSLLRKYLFADEIDGYQIKMH